MSDYTAAIQAAKEKWPGIDPETVKVYAVPMKRTAHGDYVIDQELYHYGTPDWVPVDDELEVEPPVWTEHITMEPVGEHWYMGYSTTANTLMVATV